MTIYTLSDPCTHELRYVGKTERSLAKRFREHRRNARKNSSIHLYCWWRSLSREPVVEVVEECTTTAELNEAERFWIVQFKALGFRLVNHSDGGEGQRGLKHTPETKEKISRAIKGTKNPGVSRANRGHKYKLGTTHAFASRMKTSRSLGGRSVQDQFGNVYPTVSEACRRLGLDSSAVYRVLSGRVKHHKGFTFKFVDVSLEHNLAQQET